MNDDQLDRAAGTLVAQAAGDALGAQYEFGPPLDDAVTPEFGVGVFGHGLGEWTDDTSLGRRQRRRVCAVVSGDPARGAHR